MIHVLGPIEPYDSNCYLLTGSRNILIDTGSGVCASKLVSFIKKSLCGASLDMILLTHCHIDHIGGGPTLVAEFGCPIRMGYNDAPAVRASDTTYTLSNYFGIDMPPLPVGDLRQGDIIDIGSHRLRVIETPGHTKGGVCYFDEISSSLFSGDTVFSSGVGRTDFPGGSLGELRNSIKYLEDMPVQGLYPGHGVPAMDGLDAIRRGLASIR